MARRCPPAPYSDDTEVFTPTEAELAENDPEVRLHRFRREWFCTMKLLSLILYRAREDSPFELVNCEELSSFSFFHRGPLREHIKFHRQRNSIDFDQNLGKCYSWAHPQGITATVLADGQALTLYMQVFPEH
eukprot:Skav227653  [mRNA]  locus=scaffold58:498970:502479:- [translate_table: standard]